MEKLWDKGSEAMFQPSWFQKWSWLNYREASDSVICLYCSHAFDNKLLTNALYKRAIHDVIALVQEVTLVKLVLVMPAINAISERSFSAMRRTKTYLRSTMLQECLNATIVLHVHKESTDALNLQRLSNEFVSKSNYRKSKFPVY